MLQRYRTANNKPTSETSMADEHSVEGNVSTMVDVLLQYEGSNAHLMLLKYKDPT